MHFSLYLYAHIIWLLLSASFFYFLHLATHRNQGNGDVRVDPSSPSSSPDTSLPPAHPTARRVVRSQTTPAEYQESNNHSATPETKEKEIVIQSQVGEHTSTGLASRRSSQTPAHDPAAHSETEPHTLALAASAPQKQTEIMKLASVAGSDSSLLNDAIPDSSHHDEKGDTSAATRKDIGSLASSTGEQDRSNNNNARGRLESSQSFSSFSSVAVSEDIAREASEKMSNGDGRTRDQEEEEAEFRMGAEVDLSETLEFGDYRPDYDVKSDTSELIGVYKLPISLLQFWCLFLSDSAGFSLLNFHLARGDTDAEASKWNLCQLDKNSKNKLSSLSDPNELYLQVLARDVSARVMIKGSPIGPPSSRLHKVQRLTPPNAHPANDRRNSKRLTIESVAVSPDVPFGDCFWVFDTLSCVQKQDRQGQSFTEIEIRAGVHYIKRPWKISMFTSVIESRTVEDTREGYNLWHGSALKFIDANTAQLSSIAKLEASGKHGYFRDEVNAKLAQQDAAAQRDTKTQNDLTNIERQDYSALSTPSTPSRANTASKGRTSKYSQKSPNPFSSRSPPLSPHKPHLSFEGLHDPALKSKPGCLNTIRRWISSTMVILFFAFLAGYFFASWIFQTSVTVLPGDASLSDITEGTRAGSEVVLSSRSALSGWTVILVVAGFLIPTLVDKRMRHHAAILQHISATCTNLETRLNILTDQLDQLHLEKQGLQENNLFVTNKEHF